MPHACTNVSTAHCWHRWSKAAALPMLVSAVVLLAACGSSEQPERAAPHAAQHPTQPRKPAPLAAQRPAFDPDAGFARNEQLGAQLQVAALWDGTGAMESNRVILTEKPKSETDATSLLEYRQEVIDTIVRTLPDRAPIPMRLDDTGPGFQKLRAAGVDWTTVAFTRDAGTDASVRGVICDNAGLIMDFGDSYWTLSWNSTRGKLGETESIMSQFVNSVTLVPAD